MEIDGGGNSDGGNSSRKRQAPSSALNNAFSGVEEMPKKLLKRNSLLRAERRKDSELREKENSLRRLRRNVPEVRNNESNSRKQKRNNCSLKYFALRNHSYVNESEVEQHYCGQMSSSCEHCGAMYFEKEENQKGQFSSCCHNGTVKLNSLPTLPDEFLRLFSNDDKVSSNFRTNIRSYNSALAFASFGHKSKHPPGRGPKTFVIQGQVYHKMGLDENNPKYAQLYIMDPIKSLDHRLENSYNCIPETMGLLLRLINIVNPFSNAFKTLQEVMDEENETLGDCIFNGISEPGKLSEVNESNVRLIITSDRKNDRRRYNAPTANEVAVVFKSADGTPPFDRDICIHPKRGQKLMQISILNPNCDPMTYPLLFIYGDPGWQEGLALSNSKQRKNISMLQFYSYRLQIRGSFNILQNSFRLFQQYLVDAYTKVEGTRLQWYRSHQKEIRVDNYLGLQDYIQNRASKIGLKAGKIVILPSTFLGSPRAMQQNYQDAMSIVAKYGKPDFFITFTCNPKWIEITQNLFTWQKSEDRPDLVARVFKIKLTNLLLDIVKNGVLGKVVAHVYVIEFQKRGLPHAHMLFILDEHDKFREPLDIDKAVSAELPDPDVHPRLYEIVSKNMLHGPCGALNPKAPCMETALDGSSFCSKRYPKAFSEHTNPNIDGYPSYRRRDNGRTASVRNTSFDNRWVVPYNPYLSLKYNAHINVEVCSSVKSVKYIFKYVYKGHDAANLKISEEPNKETLDHNEIENFLDTRYVGPPEGMWRLLENKMHDHSHAIVRLAIHCPGQQNVVFENGSEEAALASAEEKRTTLTAWFQLNSTSTDASHLLYTQMPYHFVFNKQSSKWTKRKQGADKVISRMYAVNPMDTERYCLRLLLLHVKGSKSFEDLRTVDNRLCTTFQEAARARNLLEDDQQWENAIDEAISFQMPKQLRHLFATICVFGNPANALSLWDKYKQDLIEDYIRSNNTEDATSLALNDIDKELKFFGKRCEDFHLPTFSRIQHQREQYDAEEEKLLANHMCGTLNGDQSDAFEKILSSVNYSRVQNARGLFHDQGTSGDDEAERTNCFFLDGPGGSGKTYVYRCLVHRVRGGYGSVACVAPTGLAATLLTGGRTVHSKFKLPLNLTETSTSNMKMNSSDALYLKNCDLIIWDEISMCNKHMLTCVDKLFKDLMDNNLPFGGKTIVVGGDFRQQLPVVKHGYRQKTLEASVKNSSIWKHFEKIQLHQNMRASGDNDFSGWLLSLGEGNLSNSSEFGDNAITIPIEYVSEKCLIQDVFGSNISSLSTDDLAGRAILCPLNEDCFQINEAILKKLEGETETFTSIDKVFSEDMDEIMKYPQEFLNSLTPTGMPPHKLNLKVGCCVMLLRNLSPSGGLCNGTRMLVRRIKQNVLDCEILSSEFKGSRVFIPRITLNPSDADVPFVLSRRQFPIRLAYCMTITKSQGQTLETVGIYLPQPVFTHGQLYTAFSRGKYKKNIKVQINSTSTQGRSKENVWFTTNVVYKEALV